MAKNHNAKVKKQITKAVSQFKEKFGAEQAENFEIGLHYVLGNPKLFFENQIAKAEKWDALNEKIYKCYFDEEGNELDSNEPGLDVIGEYAAMAFGYL